MPCYERIDKPLSILFLIIERHLLQSSINLVCLHTWDDGKGDRGDLGFFIQLLLLQIHTSFPHIFKTRFNFRQRFRRTSVWKGAHHKDD